MLVRLLILDDRDDDRSMASIAATRAAQKSDVRLAFHVLGSWQEARMLMRQIDVAVVDVGLTDADGREAAACLESQGVRTVIWTGHPEKPGDVDKNKGMDALTERLVAEFDTVGRSAPTDPELPAILLVEDDDPDAESFERTLKETGEKCDYRRVSSAEEALKLMQDGLRFQALIVDERLPGMTGGTLLRILRSRPEYGDPVVYRYSDDKTLAGKLISKPPSKYEVTLAVTAAKLAGMISILAAVHGR